MTTAMKKLEIEGKKLLHNKGYIQQIGHQYDSIYGETENIFSKMKNETRIPSLSSSLLLLIKL